MQKRQFLTSSISLLVGAVTVPTRDASATQAKTDQQTILTMVGAIDRSNRGKIDDVLEQLMHKQGIHGERAWALSLADLEKLPQTSINPTVEYDGKTHQLSGPLLIDVLNLAGIAKSAAKTILFHGIDGYSPEITVAEAKKFNYVLATRIDGHLLGIGGLGPVFAVVDADRIPELARLPLAQRFTRCPWGLYCIELT